MSIYCVCDNRGTNSKSKRILTVWRMNNQCFGVCLSVKVIQHRLVYSIPPYVFCNALFFFPRNSQSSLSVASRREFSSRLRGFLFKGKIALMWNFNERMSGCFTRLYCRRERKNHRFSKPISRLDHVQARVRNRIRKELQVCAQIFNCYLYTVS